MIRSILVVCLGNRCRSPMAADLLQRALPNCRVISAGLAPPVGATADPRVIRLLASDGIDLAMHRARAVDADLVAQADLVLVMDSEQCHVLGDRYPDARAKIFRLCEYEQTDIPDPYGGSHTMFVIVLGLIRQGVESWSAQIQGTTQANTLAVGYGEAS
jgi:protein-tyrosine phosphatase